jgi:HK97 family phage prohead protease
MTLARVDVQCRAEIRRGNKLGGYAAVFEETADLGWLGKERMAVGSLDVALRDSDVRALWEHQPRWLLGRSSAETLRLGADTRGLEWEVDLPDVSYANDLRTLVERGDITGASFGFVPGLHTWDTETQTRTHTSVAQLVDVSAVAFPAYTSASTEARSQLHRPTSRRSQLIRARARVLLGGR